MFETFLPGFGGDYVVALRFHQELSEQQLRRLVLHTVRSQEETKRAAQLAPLAGLVETCKKVFGRSFTLRARKQDGWLQLQIEETDSGNDFMTVHDMACLLQTDEATVRRMTEARAQRQSPLPVPFFKLQGKTLRFDRKKIQEWLQQCRT